MRMQGLSRLAGYRHGDRKDFGRGTNIRLAKIAETILKEPATIVLIEAIQSFRTAGQLEEAELKALAEPYQCHPVLGHS